MGTRNDAEKPTVDLSLHRPSRTEASGRVWSRYAAMLHVWGAASPASETVDCSE